MVRVFVDSVYDIHKRCSMLFKAQFIVKSESEVPVALHCLNCFTCSVDRVMSGVRG